MDERQPHVHFSPHRVKKLSDPARLTTQVSETNLVRLLALRGDEDVLDLGSGTGFYTDRIAALTTGTVYALELLPEMNAHYRDRGLPPNVQVLQGDMAALSLQEALGPDRASAQDALLRAASVDVVVTILTWHEIEGRMDVPALASVLRPNGRLVVADWRTNPEAWDNGPPVHERFSSEQVRESISSHFSVTSAEDLGRYMYAITASKL